MSYTELFYWVSVADSAKNFFDILSNIFTAFAVISTIAFVIVQGVNIFDPPMDYIRDNDGNVIKDEKNDWLKEKSKSFITIRKIISFFFYFSIIFTFISWCGYVFIPTKKDALLIVAGGGAMDYLSQDSTAKKLPSDLINYVSAELRVMAKEAEVEIKGINDKETIKKELLDLPKEELIEKIKTDSLTRKLLLE